MAEGRSSIWHRLYHGETGFRFVALWKRWFVLSGIVILVGLVSLVTRGLNLGIDFEGGTSWEVERGNSSVTDVRDTLRPLGLGEAKIQTIGGDLIRVQADIGEGDEAIEKRDEVTAALSEETGGNDVSVNNVGPSWGDDVTRKAQRALVFFFVAITLYITLRFEWKMALAALSAVAHDILLTVGVYSLSGFEVSPATVVAFLTILGYSLYDTIVVFDKVEENTKGLAATGRMTYSDVVDLSMNQVLMRSLNTSFVAVLPIASVLFVGAYGMGATALRDFGLALLIGLMTGAYSSLYIASPILALVKERESRYATIRQRLQTRGAMAGGPLTPAVAAATIGSSGGAEVPGAAPSSEPLRPRATTATDAPRPAPGDGFTTGTGQPPRGRKKQRRR